MHTHMCLHVHIYIYTYLSLYICIYLIYIFIMCTCGIPTYTLVQAQGMPESHVDVSLPACFPALLHLSPSIVHSCILARAGVRACARVQARFHRAQGLGLCTCRVRDLRLRACMFSCSCSRFFHLGKSRGIVLSRREPRIAGQNVVHRCLKPPKPKTL